MTADPPDLPAEVLDEVELADAVMRAGKRMRRDTFNRLSPYGITPSQGRALDVLARGARHGSGMIRLNQLAERLHIAPRSVTTVVDALEAAGLVARTQDPEDRRAILLRLTEAGDAMLEQIGRVRQEVAGEYFGAISPQQRTELLRLLRAVDSAYEHTHPDHGHGHHPPHPTAQPSVRSA
ncbi:MarR family winged helix-turn-helix transcriptional regulator [Streptacidiphilus sp. P02-A3a]|uniref:MarR family winged helix-turn-helix transcriptional regulator n=1 Tax=Streptacidiphilus sp. P02-A3a TaxID=2704468 RepID=UPI0015FD9F72|nr:MarR family transcriptional regulator [Streptacidiphilus sp. P02-A3a]QMU68008.1 MarR family transcriptional regulator [Streptacidiphilus sp. P02-A3a]